jgi:hypothetical protein
MSKAEQQLLDQARRQYGQVQPCFGRTLSQCFYYQNGCLQFWFNDADGNTHLLYVRGGSPA